MYIYFIYKYESIIILFVLYSQNNYLYIFLTLNILLMKFSNIISKTTFKYYSIYIIYSK